MSDLMAKYHLHLIRNRYQIPPNFHKKSIPKTHLKQTSSLNAVLISKILKNVSQKDPKMLDRNWGNRAWDHFGHIKSGFWSQRHLYSLSKTSFWSHMEASRAPFSPSASRSDEAIFVNKAQCTVPITGFTVHNLLIGAQPLYSSSPFTIQ